MATSKEMKDKLFCPPLVAIKSEQNMVVNIKMEPPDDHYENGDTSDKGGNGNAQVKVENEDNANVKVENEDNANVKVENEDIANVKDEMETYPDIENITVKVEPTCYSSDDEMNLASYQILKSQEPKSMNIVPILKIPQPKKRKPSRDEDIDYVPKKKKEKVVKEIVKKTYTTKAKKKENLYSENVTKQIELVTITEEERQIEYKDLWQNRKHMRYTCRDCAIGFVMEEPYTMHMKSHAPEAGQFECDICRCRGRSEEQMYKHRLRHYRRYRCAICRRIHKDKETAASHVMSEHIHETFTCDQCGKGFKRPAYLKKHIAQQHTKGQRHECPICARVFFDRSMYKTHFRRHNEEVRNPVKQLFICDTCCRQLRSKAALRRHLAVHARARSLACTRCPAAFHTRRGLTLHELNKHTDQEQRMLQQCPHCERECTTPALLRQHIRRMHTDRTKKYQCEHCKRFYYSKGEVRAHIVWSHAPSRGARALFCCGREFRSRTRLRDHVALHHLKLEPQRIHKCDQCEKAFANKQVLNRHKKSHSNFTYPCPECGVRFKCRAYVKVHHQLKHLNMTRAQIKALKEARRLSNTLNRGTQDQPQDLRMKSPMKEICFEKVIVKQEVSSDISDSEFSVPKFDFEDLQGGA